MDNDLVSVPIVSLPSSVGNTALILRDGCVYQLSNLQADSDKGDFTSSVQSFISVGQEDSHDGTVLQAPGSSVVSSVSGIIVDTDKGLVCMNVDSSEVVNSGMQFANLTASELQSLHNTGPLRLLGGGDAIVSSQASDLFDGHSIVTSPDETNAHLHLVTTSDSPISSTEIVSSEHNKHSKKSRKGGWPKGKKRKNPPEYAQTPKSPMTAYVIYASQRRQELRETNSNMTFSEMTRVAGKEWSQMSADEKQKYHDMADQDKERYISELKAYQATDEFKDWVKRKKEDTQSQDILHDIGSEYLPDIMDASAPLYCKLCDQYFSSHHNKREHFLGKTHLNNVAGEFKKDVEKQKDQELKEKESQESSSRAADYYTHSLKTTDDESQDCFSIDSFLTTFLEKNFEREMEIKSLRAALQKNIEKGQTLQEKVKELKDLESKLDQDVSTLNAYGAALSAQIDGLRMVPTLFGVINF